MEGEGQPVNKWQIRFERERKARKEAERLLEGKSLALYEANQQLSQKVAQQDDRIRVENERFRLIFESSLNGIIIHTPEGKILEANAMAAEVLGYTIDELLELSLHQLHPKEQHSAASSALYEVAQKGSVRFTSKFLRKDQSLFPAEITGTRFVSQGEFLIQSTIRDTSQERSAIKKIQRSERAAQEANEAKTLFLATMSHELLTPLNGLIGFAELLSESSLDSEQAEHLQLVQHCGASLHSLIKELLDFSSIESGKIQLEPKTFKLHPFFNLLAEIHRIRASEKNITLKFTLSENLPSEFYSDPSRLGQIIGNILSNAIKYSGQGTVELSTLVEDAWLKIFICDEGPGLLHSETEQLFEPYVRGRQASSRYNTGTGLGLAISKRLALALGGTITARNRLEGGAEFELCIPIKESPELNQSRPTTQTIEKPTQSHVPQNNPILIAEDNPTNSQLLKLILHPKGYPVTIVPDGKEALNALQGESTFRLILADLNMPNLDGLGLSRAIRTGTAGEKHQQVPIIAVSANLLEEDRRAALAAGMNDFLPKPISKKKLSELLAAYLD